jgi:RimJ/RimL family protein N-acetyltransferase
MTAVYNPWFKSPGSWLYSVYDTKTQKTTNTEQNFAGFVALMDLSPINVTAEIGVTIFPPFQRTHVTTNAIGLLLQWTLDPPPKGGLGLRRIKWTCDVTNEGSKKFATRLGFHLDGILRWERVYRWSSVGIPMDKLQERNETAKESKGRHTALFSMVWDEWDEKRAGVVSMMKPRN